MFDFVRRRIPPIPPPKRERPRHDRKQRYDWCFHLTNHNDELLFVIIIFIIRIVMNIIIILIITVQFIFISSTPFYYDVCNQSCERRLIRLVH